MWGGAGLTQRGVVEVLVGARFWLYLNNMLGDGVCGVRDRLLNFESEDRRTKLPLNEMGEILE